MSSSSKVAKVACPVDLQAQIMALIVKSKEQFPNKNRNLAYLTSLIGVTLLGTALNFQLQASNQLGLSPDKLVQLHEPFQDLLTVSSLENPGYDLVAATP